MFRQAVPSDLPGIQALWAEAFGDSPDFVADCIRSFPSLISYVAVQNGKIVSMAHALPLLLSPDTLAAYLYAAATAGTCRGQGLFSGLLHFLENDLRRRGFAFTALVPAEDSLFSFYQKLGYAPCFTRSHTPFPGGTPISAEAYLRLRESLLPMPHLVYDLRTLRYAARVYGLTFYQTKTGCAAASQTGTAEVLPEDPGGCRHAMGKWLTNSEPFSGGYLGFPLE